MGHGAEPVSVRALPIKIPRGRETCGVQAFDPSCEGARVRSRAVPIYEFVCMACESHYEELVPMGDDAVCPDCGSTNVRKQFSVFAAHGVERGEAAGGRGCCGGSCGCC